MPYSEIYPAHRAPAPARSATRPHISVANICARRFYGHVTALVAAARGIEHHALGRVDLGLAVGQHGLNQLEFGNRLAELLAFHGIGEGVAQHPFGRANSDGRNVQTAFIEHFHGRLETHAFHAADELRGRNAAILEDDVARVRAALAHFLVGFAERQPRRFPLDNKRGNAARAFGVARARHHGKDAGFRRVS